MLFVLYCLTSYLFTECLLIPGVTEQTGTRARGTLTRDPTISVEGNRLLFTGLQPQGGWEHSCSEPCFPTKASTSLAPHKAVSQKHAQKFPIPLSVLKLAAQTVLHPLCRHTHGFQNHHPPAAALSFRIWGTLSSASA